MHLYPKQILSLSDQLQSLKNAGLQVSNDTEAQNILSIIGYYRLRGYTYPFYDNNQKTFKAPLSFHEIMDLYDFDQKLSHCLFCMLSKIEVSLRAHLTDALTSQYNDALILYDPEIAHDKSLFWKNLATISLEISRSKDIFIRHNFDKHDGHIPIWAAVEVVSFGTISKIIKNLKTGTGSAYDKLAQNYSFKTQKGTIAKPTIKAFSSWIQTVAMLRNRCAHNARIYNRSINTRPEILHADRSNSSTQRFAGTYEAILAMKYLRPDDSTWKDFINELTSLFAKYSYVISMVNLNFPSDWKNHL